MNRATSVAVILLSVASLQAVAAKNPSPVRMGNGFMTFETVPGWGLDTDGKSVLGPTHGGVVIDSEGSIYTSAQRGVYVFSPEGEALEGGHDTCIHKTLQCIEQLFQCTWFCCQRFERC